MALIAGALLIIYFGTGIIITRRANRNIYKETEKEAYKIDAGGHSDEERVEYIRERDELNPDNKLKKVSVQLLLINYFAKSGCKVLMVVGIAMRILLLI